MLFLSDYSDETGVMGNAYNGKAYPRIFRLLEPWVRSDLIQKGESSRLQDFELFFQVLKGDAPYYLSAKADQKDIERARFKGLEELPSDEDVRIFTDFINAKKEIVLKVLARGFSAPDYQTLLQMTAIDVLLYNVKRPGETERAELVDWNKAKRLGKDSEERRRLSKANAEQVEKYLRVDIRGKKESGMGSFYVSFENELTINLILKYRSDYGVHPDNPFLFGEKQDSSNNMNHRHINVCKLLREESLECSTHNKINHHCIRATKLRKRGARLVAEDEELSEHKDLMLKQFEYKEATHNQYYSRRPGKIDAVITKNLEIISQRRATRLPSLPCIDEEQGICQEDDNSESTVAEEGCQMNEKSPEVALEAPATHTNSNDRSFEEGKFLSFFIIIRGCGRKISNIKSANRHCRNSALSVRGFCKSLDQNNPDLLLQAAMKQFFRIFTF